MLLRRGVFLVFNSEFFFAFGFMVMIDVGAWGIRVLWESFGSVVDLAD